MATAIGEMTSAAAGLQIRPFSETNRGDAMRVINAYTAGWPYSRPVDDVLLAHWLEMDAKTFQPEHVLLAYRDGKPRAFCHGQRSERRHDIHLLAVMPGAVDDAVALLAAVESGCRANGVECIDVSTWRAATFYAGYVIGQESCHPHWATDTTDAFVRARYRVSLQGVLMVRDLKEPVQVDPFPPGYEPVAQQLSEFGAQAFGYHAHCEGRKAAHCYCRLYPALLGAGGKPVGQMGNVTTDESHRGRGLARVMVQMCLRDLRAMGAGECLIATSLDNPPALKAYENAGFARRHHLMCWQQLLAAKPAC